MCLQRAPHTHTCSKFVPHKYLTKANKRRERKSGEIAFRQTHPTTWQEAEKEEKVDVNGTENVCARARAYTHTQWGRLFGGKLNGTCLRGSYITTLSAARAYYYYYL